MHGVKTESMISRILNNKHLMPTRYAATEVTFDKLSAKHLKGPVRNKTHRFQTRLQFGISCKQD
ncbi:hypothetical protein GQX74_009197 [Glossina fuscipes]|nr:hypothetical protein GQX74_009197 [Glossina fuscipes]